MLQYSRLKGAAKPTTHEEIMETTMLRRSIKDNKTIENNMSEKLGYAYTRYEKPSPTYKAKS